MNIIYIDLHLFKFQSPLFIISTSNKNRELLETIPLLMVENPFPKALVRLWIIEQQQSSD